MNCRTLPQILTNKEKPSATTTTPTPLLVLVPPYQYLGTGLLCPPYTRSKSDPNRGVAFGQGFIYIKNMKEEGFFLSKSGLKTRSSFSLRWSLIIVSIVCNHGL